MLLNLQRGHKRKQPAFHKLKLSEVRMCFLHITCWTCQSAHSAPKSIRHPHLWLCSWPGVTAHCYCPASWEPGERSKFKMQFLLNEYGFPTTAKSKNFGLNHHKSRTICISVHPYVLALVFVAIIRKLWMEFYAQSYAHTPTTTAFCGNEGKRECLVVELNEEEVWWWQLCYDVEPREYIHLHVNVISSVNSEGNRTQVLESF